MANTHSNLTDLFSDIAEKIRTKTGTTDNIVADSFPDKIGNILTPADGSIPTKTASDLSASGANIIVPSGYYANDVSKSVNSATQATPSIDISVGGLITASSVQEAGYVSSGTKSATRQLSTNKGGTFTPKGTPNPQTVANAGQFLLNPIQIAGSDALKSENIKNGVDIFGVTGNYTGDVKVVYNPPIHNTGLGYIINAAGQQVYNCHAFLGLTISEIVAVTAIIRVINSMGQLFYIACSYDANVGGMVYISNAGYSMVGSYALEGNTLIRFDSIGYNSLMPLTSASITSMVLTYR